MLPPVFFLTPPFRLEYDEYGWVGFGLDTLSVRSDQLQRRQEGKLLWPVVWRAVLSCIAIIKEDEVLVPEHSHGYDQRSVLSIMLASLPQTSVLTLYIDRSYSFLYGVVSRCPVSGNLPGSQGKTKTLCS